MGPGLPQGHPGSWRRRSALQLGQSAGGSSQESSPHSYVRVRPGCWGSGLPLTQCCQSNPVQERREREGEGRNKKNVRDKKKNNSRYSNRTRRERRRKDRRRADILSSLGPPATGLSVKIYSLKPVATSNFSSH